MRTALNEPPRKTVPPSADGTVAAVRELCRGSFAAEAEDWEREGGVPPSAYARLAAAGAFAGRWPDGARGPGCVDVGALVVSEMAQVSVGACIAVGTHMEAYFRALARCDYGTETWDDAVAGRRVGALSVTERAGGSNPTNCETLAERTPEGWVLSGHKHYVSNMRAADDVVVFARTDRRRPLSSFTLFVVPTDAAGVTVTPHRMVGAAASATAQLDFESVAVGDERRVGAVGSGLALLLDLLRAERVMAACAGLAVAELCFEIAFAFADSRVVAGGRLRAQQAIAHRLATLASDIAAGRALLAERLNAARAGRLSSAEAGQAKLVLNRVAWRAADEAMQILGGRGFSEETPLARIWRDIRIGRIGGGTDEVQLELIAQALRPGELAAHPAVTAAVRAAGA